MLELLLSVLGFTMFGTGAGFVGGYLVGSQVSTKAMQSSQFKLMFAANLVVEAVQFFMKGAGTNENNAPKSPESGGSRPDSSSPSGGTEQPAVKSNQQQA